MSYTWYSSVPDEETTVTGKRFRKIDPPRCEIDRVNREARYIRRGILVMLAVAAFFAGWFIGCFVYGEVALAENYICCTQKGTWVNVRATPSPDGEKIGRLRYGYEIDALETRDGYFRFRQKDGTEGWARIEFFERPVHERGTVTERVVTRARPNGRKINHLNPGSWIDILAYTTDEQGVRWARCYGNVYVMAKYLEVTK